MYIGIGIMTKFTFSVQNIVNGEGIGISITGMLIVFSALILISIFISVLPWVLKKLEFILPRGDEILGYEAPRREPSGKVDESIAAAIGYALFKERMPGGDKT
jgi:oxaloacetate decarboxylase gamma subunit